MSDHSGCEHALFPPCALSEAVGPYLSNDDDGGHGPAIGPFPMLNTMTGEARAIWLCVPCWRNTELTVTAAPSLGAVVLTAIAPFAKPWAEIEADVLAALDAHPGDTNLNSLLAQVQNVRVQAATRENTEATVEIVLGDRQLAPMTVNAAAALFARTSTTYPKREEIN